MASYKLNPEKNALDRQMKTVKFFTMYFSKLRYLIFANVLFLIFDVAAAAYIYFLNPVLNSFEMIPILICSSFSIFNIGMSGITTVVRYIYTGKEFSTVKAFFKGIKENWLKFLVHGIVFSLLSSISCVSIVLYYNKAKDRGIFWFLLGITVLLSLFALFGSYYLNIMTETMAIDMKHIYKNCMLFSFGEIKNNLRATFGLLVFSAIIISVIRISAYSIYTIIICAVLIALFAPSTIQFIITFYIFDSMVDILDESRKNEKTEKTINKTDIKAEEARKIIGITADNNDEYIFYNGKMVKRSLVENAISEKCDDNF